jgi:hypothetical protein
LILLEQGMKYAKHLKTKQFFIFFIISLLSTSVVSADFWDWVTGEVTDGICTDSDGGKNYDTAGNITYDAGFIQDDCLDDKTL